MNLHLAGKRVLVTGSSRGIGFGIARRFLEEGALVCLASRAIQRSEVLSVLPAALHERTLVEACDFVSMEGIQKLRASIVQRFGGLDVLICNVGKGSGSRDPLPDWESFSESFDVNFKSPYLTTHVFLDDLTSSRGNVVFIGSIAGLESIGAPTSYTVSKAALKAFCVELARKLGAQVRFNMIAPGNIYFEGGSWELKLRDNPGAVKDMLDSKVPLKRFGTTEEIANAALFLASPGSAFANGSVLVMDGGQTVGL